MKAPLGESSSSINAGEENRSIEQIYQKKTQLEHILLRPDTYSKWHGLRVMPCTQRLSTSEFGTPFYCSSTPVGSTESVTQPMWVLDDAQKKLVQRNISFVPGLYKIFDEIMVNASDNKQRDPTMDTIKITIDQVNLLSLFVKHTVRKLYATHCIPL